MRTRAGAAAVVLATSLAVGCASPLGSGSTSPGAGAHDRAVADLERRAAAEDGWLVLPLPNLHEGGGVTTWWLHPCEPDRDRHREVIRTAYHGSDVAGLPGHHVIESDRLPCEPPTTALDVGGRRLALDVDAVHLGGGSFGLLEDRERVRVTDPVDGVARTVAVSTQPTDGPCDGRSHWTAALDSSRELRTSVRSCVGALAALPAAAVSLLDLPPGGDAHHTSSARLPSAHHRELLEALRDGGFTTEDGDPAGIDEEAGSLWSGPCGPTVDPRRDGETRTLVDVYGGHVTVSESTCR